MKRLFFRLLNGIAHWYIAKHKPYVIGITGSVGKTSCRMSVTKVLSDMLPQLRIATSQKNFNSIEAGFALAVLDIADFSPSFVGVLKALSQSIGRCFGQKRYDVLVLEYGIDHPGDMDDLLAVARPDLAIFTAIDKVHAAYFATAEDILFEKSKLLQAARDVVCYPIEGAYIGPYLAEVGADQLSYSISEDTAHEADIGFVGYQLILNAGRPEAHFTLVQGRETIAKAGISVMGIEQAGYTSLGVALAMILGRRYTLSLEKTVFAQGKETELYFSLPLQPGRSTIFLGKQESILIDSSYNAAPQSMRTMIDNCLLLRQQLYPERQMMYCLGDMRELGEYSEHEHRALAQYVASSADALFLVGEQCRFFVLDELTTLGYNSSRVFWFPDSTALGYALSAYVEKQSQHAVILFKGSQNTIFLEEAVKQMLVTKSDEAYLCRQGPWWLAKKHLS